MGNHLEFYFEAKFKAISEASKVTIDQQDNRAMGGAESPGHRSQEVQRPRRTSSSGREFKDAYCWTKALSSFPGPIRTKPPSVERKLGCTLEELCRGCKKEVEFTRDIVTNNGFNCS